MVHSNGGEIIHPAKSENRSRGKSAKKPFVRTLLEQEPESTVVERVTDAAEIRRLGYKPIFNSVDCEDFKVG